MTDGQLSNVMTPPYSISTVKRRIGKYMLHRLCVIGCTERDGMDESQDRVILTEDQSNDCRCWNILLCINLIELSADCRTLSQVREQVHEMSKRQTNRKRKAKSLFHAQKRGSARSSSDEEIFYASLCFMSKHKSPLCLCRWREGATCVLSSLLKSTNPRILRTC